MSEQRSFDPTADNVTRIYPKPPLETSSDGGDSNDMDSRVTRLEAHMEYVRRDLDEIRGDQKAILAKLVELPTKRDLDTWRWQWLATGLAIVALTVGGITGGLALIARFAG
ncbi:hypothetical protein ACO2Q0_02820 [Phenylobacterium sp. VNQ135]|uniref:hypothetical protein n=1 Tax=Phenylobacterium sp. VNQ135 TaxID=3400922 RepID=UPI003C0E770E